MEKLVTSILINADTMNIRILNVQQRQNFVGLSMRQGADMNMSTSVVGITGNSIVGGSRYTAVGNIQ